MFRSVILLILFALGVPVIGQPVNTMTTQDSVNELLSKGGVALKAQDFGRAIEHLQAALRLDSLNQQALRNLGAAFASRGEYDQAKAYLDKAYRLNPKDGEVCNNLGVVAIDQKDPAAAIKWFEAAVAIDSTSALYLTSLGQEYLRIQRIQKALPLLQKAHQLSPKNPIPLFLLGNCFSADREFDSSVAYYEKSVAAGGTAPDLYYFLGIAKLQLGKMDEAEKNYKLALERNPKYKECLQGLGLLYAQQGKFVAANAQFEKVVQVDSLFYQGWVSLGATCAITQQFARADTILYKLMKVDSTWGKQMLYLIQMEQNKQAKKNAPDSTGPPPKK